MQKFLSIIDSRINSRIIDTTLKFTLSALWNLSGNLSNISCTQLAAIICFLPTLEHSSAGCALVVETLPFPPQDHKSGTVCRPISDYVGCHTASSGGCWRHFYLDSEATSQCELFFIVPNRNILTYYFTQTVNALFRVFSTFHIWPRYHLIYSYS